MYSNVSRSQDYQHRLLAFVRRGHFVWCSIAPYRDAVYTLSRWKTQGEQATNTDQSPLRKNRAIFVEGGTIALAHLYRE